MIVKPTVTLLAHTPDPDAVVAAAARLCYSDSDIESLVSKTSQSDQKRYLAGLFNSGHLSPFEHASFTFGVEGVSRTLLAQITRHRLASFSVQSQRYVGMQDFGYVIPESISNLGDEYVSIYMNQMDQMKVWYNEWARLVEKEDARFVLPGAAETRLVFSMNARELLHFFDLRCCDRAQWEIRSVAWRMLKLVRDVAPNIFAKAGPGCVRGKCPEGKMSCGKPYNADGTKAGAADDA